MEDQETLPALFDHCTAVYGAMIKAAGTAVMEDDNHLEEDLRGKPVYEGHLTRLFAELGLSTPYYTSVMTRLKRMRCVEQLRRGGGNAHSRWVLKQEPTEALWNAAIQIRSRKGDRLSRLEQQVRDLQQTTADLMGKVNALLGVGNA